MHIRTFFARCSIIRVTSETENVRECEAKIKHQEKIMHICYTIHRTHTPTQHLAMLTVKYVIVNSKKGKQSMSRSVWDKSFSHTKERQQGKKPAFFCSLVESTTTPEVKKVNLKQQHHTKMTSNNRHIAQQADILDTREAQSRCAHKYSCVF